jgi:hypothetical protein
MTTGRSFAVTITVLLGLAASGCGGGGEGHFDLQTTLNCLKHSGVNAKVDMQNPLFSSAEGSIDADFGRFDIYIGFGRDSGQAHDLANGVNAVGSAFNSKGKSVTRGNVAYYANDTSLNRDAQGVVDACLGQDENMAKSSFSKFVAGHPPLAYPQSFVSSFVTSCEGHTTAVACQCLINHAQSRYTYAQFLVIGQAISDATSPKYAQAQALIAGCRS